LPEEWEKDGKLLIMGKGFLLEVTELFWDYTRLMTAQLYEYTKKPSHFVLQSG
jgi:hypothetical protein